MPEVPKMPGVFFVKPDTEEAVQLGARWNAGEFAARCAGSAWLADGRFEPATMYVSAGSSVAETIKAVGLAGFAVAANYDPPAIAFLPNDTDWNLPQSV